MSALPPRRVDHPGRGGVVLVTGGNGFVGRALVVRLLGDGVRVRAAVRRAGASMPPEGAEQVEVGDIGSTTDWRGALDGVSAVVHCAALVHRLRENAADPLAAHRAVNRDATLRLASQAAAAGVARFVFLSTIGVNGAETFGTPFRADDPPAPHSPYALAKHEAEQGLASIVAETGLGVVIVRPPLVYGPGAPGNFQKLLRAVAHGLPLPLGAVHNLRSFVAIGNLIDLLTVCLIDPQALGRTLLVSDGEDLSTTEFVRRIARALGRPDRLFPLPASWLRGAVRLLGRPELGRQLFGSLQLDIDPTRALLGWQPPFGVEEALRASAQPSVAARQPGGPPPG